MLKDRYSRLSHFHKLSTIHKNNLVEYRQFILIFALVRTVILFTVFPRYEKLNFLFNDITEDYSQKMKGEEKT